MSEMIEVCWKDPRRADQLVADAVRKHSRKVRNSHDGLEVVGRLMWKREADYAMHSVAENIPSADIQLSLGIVCMFEVKVASARSHCLLLGFSKPTEPRNATTVQSIAALFLCDDSCRQQKPS